MFFISVLFFSISTIQAGDVNVTDAYSSNFNEDIALQIEDDMQTDNDNSENALNVEDNDILTANGKNQTSLSSKTNEIYYNGYYSLTLTDDDSNVPLVNKSLTFSINNVDYTAVTDNNGVAKFNLNLTPGKYPANAYFSGDSTHQSCSLSSYVQILPTIKASDISKYYKGSKKYTAVFYDTYGNPLKNCPGWIRRS